MRSVRLSRCSVARTDEARRKFALRELELYIPVRYSLERTVLTLSAAPLLTIISLVALGQDGERSYVVDLIWLTCPLLYMFILYHILRLQIRIMRIKSYLGYLEDLISGLGGSRDVLIWEREVDIAARYTVASVLQVGFHVAAFVTLGSVYGSAFGRVVQQTPLLAGLSLFLLMVSVFALCYEVFAAIASHWDTKATISMDRVRNRLNPLPPYYCDFLSYLRLKPFESSMLRKVSRMRRVLGSPCPVGPPVGLKEGSAPNLLATEALFNIFPSEGNRDAFQRYLNDSDSDSRSWKYLCVSFARKDTLMAFFPCGDNDSGNATGTSDGRVFRGIASLIVPMGAGDEVLIWSLGKWGGRAELIASGSVTSILRSL